MDAPGLEAGGVTVWSETGFLLPRAPSGLCHQRAKACYNKHVSYMIGIWLAHVGTGNRADCKKAVGRLPEGRRETMGDFSFKPLTMQESGALLRHARITLCWSVRRHSSGWTLRR